MVTNLGSVVTVETVIQPGNETAHCQETDTDIVKLAKQFRDVLRVAAEGMKEAREAKTQDCSNEEEEEDELLPESQVRVALVAERLDIEDYGHGNESNKSYKMCPNVSSLGVNTKDRLETL